MPTYDVLESFLRDYDRLSPEERELFLAAKEKFVQDADSGRFRASLRVKPMRRFPGIWEMTWEGRNGRATFEYAPSIRAGKRHIVWRRIGGHEIFQKP